jgi:ABC-2 type transport system ATP-binding protein
VSSVPPAITVTDLVKRYGDVIALAGVSFEVEEGEVLALLGPNGAGKTTAVEILEGYRQADSGDINVLGFHPSTGGRGFRDRIGIVLQETGIELVLTVREVIELYGVAYTRRRPATELISLVGLEDKTDARIKTLSGGQRRRLDLALGLVGDPDLVFLDEPTTGFDPAARRKSWELVEGLTALGKTILLTTHYLDEAQHLADRIVVLNQGKIVAEGTPETLGAAQAVTTIKFRLADCSRLPAIGDGPHVSENKVTYRTADPTTDLYTLTRWAVRQGVNLDGLEVTRPSLEDVYLDIMDRADREGQEG